MSDMIDKLYAKELGTVINNNVEEVRHGKNGHQIDLDLKHMVQATYEKQGHSIEEIRKVDGR